MLDRKFLLGTTVIAGFAAALAVAAPSVSFAQTTPSSASNDDTEVEALVVTGSRIKRSEFTSAAPIQVITSEAATLEGLVDTAEILQGSSIASGSFQISNQLTGYVTDGGPGANSISLRGLGANRTLVLLNGRRLGPAGTRGTVGPVDPRVVPGSVWERAEILKDGASSIYGSDAVAGVVNIITKQNYDGFELSAYTSQPFETGGERYQLSGSWGKTFDRGYVNLSFDYNDQKVLRWRDRDDLACARDMLQAGGPNGALLDYTNTDPGQEFGDDSIKCYNIFTRVLRTGRFGDLIYPDAGVTYPTAAQGNSGGLNNAGDAWGSLPVPFGLVRQSRAGFPLTHPYAHQDAPARGRQSAISPAKLTTVFASAGYDLTPSTEIYGEFLANRRESIQYGSRQLFPSVNAANANIPAGWAAEFVSFLPIIPLKSDREQTVDYWRGVVGIRGDFGSFLEGWDWDAYYQYSSSDAEYGTDIIYNDRIVAVTGALACNQAAITFSGGNCANLPGGVPWTSARIINGDFNAAEQAFLFTHEVGTTTYTQKAFEATMSGKLFDLPAGPVGAAFGISWRQDEIDDTPGPNERGGNLWGSTSAGRTAGKDTVKEVFGEVEIPLFRGLPGIESLTGQLSTRYTEYDSYGADSTYKIGLNWQITPSWRIRATDGTSFRAPALYELYLANQTSFANQTAVDPCISWENSTNPFIQANCSFVGVPVGYTGAGTSSATVVTGGGLGVLKAETSKAQTVGLIWTPSFINVSVAIDYFEILVEDEVRTFGAGNIANQCYTSPTFPADAFCMLVNRYGYNQIPNTPAPIPAMANSIQQINNSYVNVAEQFNRGMDLTVRYQHEFDFGRLTVDGQFTWQFEDTVALLAGVANNDFNGLTYTSLGGGFFGQGPDFTGNIRARFDRGDWTVFWGVDLTGKGSDTEYYGGDTFNGTKYSSQCRVGAGPVAPCSTLIGTGPLTVISVPMYYKQYMEFTALHNVSVRKRHNDWTFQAGIRNLFDEASPGVSTGQLRIGTAQLGFRDALVGRSMFFELSKKW